MASFKLMVYALWLGVTHLASVAAQFPKPPEGVTVIKSKFNSDITISFKEPGICETTPGVKSYSGYVHLPPGTLGDLGEKQDYPINTFFWFFEARKDPENAPLSIWMNGGPGSSSLLGLLVENGPCFVNPDSNSTTLNPWSWNNEVNMLYLDQPVQVGFSYDVLANFTYDLISGSSTKLEDGAPIPEQNATFLVGTFPSDDRNSTAQGTRNAAIALWHFAQVWFQEFPGYHPNDSRINIATESYGGRYGPGFAAFFEEQNQKIEKGSWKGEGAHVLNLDTLLIINGCIDRQVQGPSYPHIAFNNTYGIETVNASIYEEMMANYTRPGGCRDQVVACRAAASASDPDNLGANATANKVCADAETYCAKYVRGGYQAYSGRNSYDMGQLDPDPFPAPFYRGWLNQPHVQEALGVPLNFTQSSDAVSRAFRGIGDFPRPGHLEHLAYLLENNIKLALVYGDRDYACNWIGGEALSLAIEYAGTKEFHAAGYVPIQTNESHVGGQVRQHGNLSFSRVYEAGHEVPSYQPETAYRVFMRTISNRDIATGEVDTLLAQGGGDSYATEGPADTWSFRSEPPAPLTQFCYVLDAATCTDEQMDGARNGSAEVRSWIVVDRNSTGLFPDVVGSASEPPSPPSSGPAAPSPTNAAAGRISGALGRGGVVLLTISILIALVV